MNIRARIYYLLPVLFVAVICTDCGTSRTKASQETVKEIAPGLLQGYLSMEELPNSLALIPPPPEEGSPGYALDQDYATRAVTSKDTTRFKLATNDAYLYFPEAALSFQSTLGLEISESKMLHCLRIQRRIIISASGLLWRTTRPRVHRLTKSNCERMVPILQDIRRSVGRGHWYLRRFFLLKLMLFSSAVMNLVKAA